VTIALLVVVVLVGVGVTAWWHWTTGQLLREGEKALAAREYARAREYLQRYLSARPGDARARLLAARAARRLREYYEAHEHLARCRSDGGDREAIDVEEALIAVQRGDLHPVADLRERSRQEDELALVILEVLIQHDLDTYQLWQALHGLNQYLRQRPDDLQALLGRASVWERVLYFKDAVEDYRKAVAAHPDNQRARLRLAETLLIAGTPAEALKQYQWLEERWPERPEVRLGLARCRRRLGEPESARKLLDGLLAEHSRLGEVFWERGQLALDDGKPAEAERLLRRAVHLLPHDRRVHYALYRCLDELKRPAEAEAVKARVDRIDADLRKLDEVRHKVMKSPGDAALRCEGGLLFLRNGERREGIRWLRLALRLDPTCETARKALAEVEAQPGPQQ
jgi:Tfp pilus assembly protein PilF